MSYDTSIPATGHSGSQDYTGMQQNFLQIQNSFSVNHKPLASGSNDGFHTKVQIPSVISDPNLASPAVSVYTKTASGKSELFFQNGNLAADARQITGAFLAASNGYAFLSGGILLQWGSTNGNGSSPLPVSFNVNFSGNAYNVVACPGTFIVSLKIQSFNNSGFSMESTPVLPTGQSFRWFAVGPA